MNHVFTTGTPFPAQGSVATVARRADEAAVSAHPDPSTNTGNEGVARDALCRAVACPGNPASTSAPMGPADSDSVPPRRGGRKKAATSERRAFICELLAKGESEKAACLRAGISESAWGEAKKTDAGLRRMIAAARDDWAALRHRQHVNARRESQWHRSAARKPLRETPTKQANLVVWHLVRRVSLDWAAIPEGEIAAACARFNLSLDTWRRQEAAFGLMKKVYAKRAKIRGESRAPIRSFDFPVYGTDSQESFESDDAFRWR